MTIRSLIGNMKLRSKFFCMTVMLVLMLVGLGGYGFWLLSDNAQKLSNVQSGALKQTDEIIAFHHHALKSVIGLYRVVTAASSESDKVKIAALSAASLKDYEALAVEMGTIRPTLEQAGVTITQVDIFEIAMKAYIKEAHNVIDMAESDPATAAAWMTGTMLKYEEMFTQLEAMVEIAEKNKDEAFAGLDEQSHAARMVFATSGAVIANLAIILSALLGNMISRQIVAMARSVGVLARKDYVEDDSTAQETKDAGERARALRTLQHELMVAEEELQRRKTSK